MMKPLPMQTTTLLVNQFIVQTTHFLNSFSETLEKKIAHISSRVTELEILMSVFEAKINSVAGMGLDTAALPDTTANAPAAAAPAASAPPSASLPSVSGGAPSAAATPAPAPAAAPAPAPAPAPAGPVVKDDPNYSKFFKMLKVGVPMPVIEGKMRAEGLDPKYLETPDAPAPSAGGAAAGGVDID